MKRFFNTGICILLSVLLLAGCSCERGDVDPTEATEEITEAVEEVLLPIEEGLDMIYASGAGAWGTNIYLNADGSFTGSYHDTDMGSMGDGYDSTVYESEFKGKFTNIRMIEDYAFAMTLESLETEKPEGTEVIEDWDGVMVLTVASEALGIAGGEEFIFYLPNTPIKVLEEEFMSWNPARNEKGSQLKRYGLYNITTGAGFFTYD